MSIIWFALGFVLACFLPDVVDQFVKKQVIKAWKFVAARVKYWWKNPKEERN